jgi:hypothetical protein
MTEPRGGRVAAARIQSATTAAALTAKANRTQPRSDDDTATAIEGAAKVESVKIADSKRYEKEVGVKVKDVSCNSFFSMLAKDASAAIADSKRYEEEVGVKIKDVKCNSFFSALSKDAALTVANSKRLDGAGVDVASLACDSFFSRIRDNTFVVAVIFLSSEFSRKTLRWCINSSPLIKHVGKMAEDIRMDERKAREFSSRIGSGYCESSKRLAAELSGGKVNES